MITVGVTDISEIPPRTAYYMGLAESAAMKSTHERIKIGTLILTKTGLRIFGWNQKKTHPIQRKYNELYRPYARNHYIHSELHALSRYSGSLEGGVCFVSRADALGNVAECKPCPACFAALRDSGIKLVYHTSPEPVRCAN
jgi:deoxycytidylate deaminase